MSFNKLSSKDIYEYILNAIQSMNTYLIKINKNIYKKIIQKFIFYNEEVNIIIKRNNYNILKYLTNWWILYKYLFDEISVDKIKSYNLKIKQTNNIYDTWKNESFNSE